MLPRPPSSIETTPVTMSFPMETAYIIALTPGHRSLMGFVEYLTIEVFSIGTIVCRIVDDDNTKMGFCQYSFLYLCILMVDVFLTRIFLTLRIP